jgi:hypothetical protein
MKPPRLVNTALEQFTTEAFNDDTHTAPSSGTARATALRRHELGAVRSGVLRFSDTTECRDSA